MADPSLVVQVINLLQLSPESFVFLDDHRGIFHRKLGFFRLHRWRGIVHEGYSDAPGERIERLVEQKRVVSTRRLPLHDSWRLRRAFDRWLQRPFDMEAMAMQDVRATSAGGNTANPRAFTSLSATEIAMQQNALHARLNAMAAQQMSALHQQAFGQALHVPQAPKAQAGSISKLLVDDACRVLGIAVDPLA